MPVITIEGLIKRFGDVQAVDDLSFEVQQGTVTGFIGPNGAGKTTTLRMLLGLIRPTAGSALIHGVPALRHRGLEPPADENPQPWAAKVAAHDRKGGLMDNSTGLDVRLLQPLAC